jgi:hypothetical protein
LNEGYVVSVVHCISVFGSEVLQGWLLFILSMELDCGYQNITQSWLLTMGDAVCRHDNVCFRVSVVDENWILTFYFFMFSFDFFKTCEFWEFKGKSLHQHSPIWQYHKLLMFLDMALVRLKKLKPSANTC